MTCCQISHIFSASWKLVSALHKARLIPRLVSHTSLLTVLILQAVHHQIQKDSELLDMVEEVRTAFDFSTEASQLNTSTTMLKEKVKDLLRETVKCSRFVQEYARRDFLGTCVTPS